VKFIFADSLDLIDPSYDFATDQSGAARQPHWDDRYPHELMNPAPYDGLLVSRGIVGDHLFPGKYSSAQAMRFRRDGARKFLRLDAPRFKHMPIYGDSGAFSYVKEEKPPYTPSQVLEFYADAGFTHACAVDHVIFDFDREESGRVRGSEQARYRSEITLENAREFLKLAKSLGPGFTPIGVAQGWSPSSMSSAAAKLEKMGYSYIALGGLVPLRAEDIHRCLASVRERISSKTRIHLLGFAKAEDIEDFVNYGIESFDSTSPLLRAFKDARSNYYVLADKGLDYYAAVRIPQALENPRLARAAKEGRLHQETLVDLERKALEAVRGYDRNSVKLEDAVERVADYGSLLADDPVQGSPSREKLRNSIREATRRTLGERPWSKCPCEICRAASVEVVIFRSSNRNKRRGFHNLGVFFQHVQRLLGKELASEYFQVPRAARAAKR
jgi:Queuine tRNA-ribosyltransferase